MSLNRRTFVKLVSSGALWAGVRPSGLLAAAADARSDFDVRGLELCGSGFWQWENIDRALDLMSHLGLNTLIVSQDDLPNSIVWPRAYFSEDFMFARDPTHMTVSHSGGDYLRQAIRRAARKNIQVFIAAKEISYPYLLVELHPQLMEIKGIVCPTHPLWWQFERARYQEIVESLPDVAGVMISAGTNESEVSFAARQCTCARCRSYSSAQWHENLVRSIYEPFQAKGKRMVVRDSSATRAEQAAILAGCAKVSPEIIVSLKNTPQDFCPVFPDNPQIGRTPGATTWVEFDTAGQFAGQSVFAVSLVADLQRRLQHASSSGVKGVWFRADLEAVSDASAFNSANLLNVFAGGLLSARVDRPRLEIVERWLAFGLVDPLQTASEEGAPVPLGAEHAERLARFLEAAWNVMAKTIYVRGLVFADGTGCVPESLDAASDNLFVLHAREEWEAGSAARLDPTEANLAEILAEKAQAVREASSLAALLRPEALPVPDNQRTAWAMNVELFNLYVAGFQRAAAAYFKARRAQTTRAAGDIADGRRAAAELAAHGDRVGGWLDAHPQPHFVCRIMDPAPSRSLAQDVREKMAEIEWLKKNG